MQEVVHGPQLEPALAAEQSGIVPQIGQIVFVEIVEHLLDDVTAFDDVLGLGLVMGLGKADHMDDVGLHVHLPVGRDGQVTLGLVQVRRKVGQPSSRFLDNSEIRVAGQWFDQFVSRLEFGQVVQAGGAGRQVIHHLHHILPDAQLEGYHAGDDVVGHQHVVGTVAQLPLVGVVDLERLVDRCPPAYHLKVLVKAIPDRDGAAAVQLVVEKDGDRREGHAEFPLVELGQLDQLVGAGVDARHRVIAPLRGLLEPAQVLFAADGHAALTLEVLVGVLFAAHKLGQVLLRRLVGRQ